MSISLLTVDVTAPVQTSKVFRLDKEIVKERRYAFSKLLDEDLLDVDEETHLLEIRKDTAKELEVARRTFIIKSISNGLPQNMLGELTEMDEEDADIFRIKLTKTRQSASPLSFV